METFKRILRIIDDLKTKNQNIEFGGNEQLCGMLKQKVLTFCCVIFMLFAIVSCGEKPKNASPKYGTTSANKILPEYSFAVHPLHNPTKLFETYQPLIDYLNARLKGARLALEASRDYGAFEEKYNKRKPDFLLPNPWQTLQAIKNGYMVIAMAGEPTDFKGIFIVRKDGNILRPADLKGKAVSYPAPTALAACIMPQYFLYKNGIDVNHDIDNRYVGSQESAIMNVYLKNTVAGATWPPPWRAFQREHPREAADLKVLWETESLINNSVMVRNDVPVELREQIRSLLTRLHETEEGKAILLGIETLRFIRANDNNYDVVRGYVARFEKEVRKIETK
jgi:phosphonate transport system substrate-binding protein